jgi:hypothetical protein
MIILTRTILTGYSGEVPIAHGSAIIAVLGIASGLKLTKPYNKTMAETANSCVSKYQDSSNRFPTAEFSTCKRTSTLAIV